MWDVALEMLDEEIMCPESGETVLLKKNKEIKIPFFSSPVPLSFRY